MKMPLETVLAAALQNVDDGQRAIVARHSIGAFVDYGLGKTFVADVPAPICDEPLPLIHQQVFRVCLLEHAKEKSRPQLVLLLAVDNHCVVTTSAAKEVATLRIGRIDVAARIDEHWNTVDVKFEAELIVVFVIAESVSTDDAVSDDQVAARLTYDGQSGVSEMTHARDGGRHGSWHVTGIEAPPRRFPWPTFAAERRPCAVLEATRRGTE